MNENGMTRFEINTYVTNGFKKGTLILDYISSALSMDPVNVFKNSIPLKYEDGHIEGESENIFLNTLTASLMVVDTADLINNIGIQGQEFVEMEIETPSLEDFSHTLTFSVYKVGAREDANAGAALYELSLVSPEFLLNHRRRISKSYEANISDIVRDALVNPLHIQTEKNLYIEPTKGIRKIVSPNVHPYTLIKHLATEAQSLRSSSPHYLFFENLVGFNFVSLQELYRQPSLGEYKVIHAGELKENNTVSQFSVHEHTISKHQT